jgi:predicted metal-dependent enzyme (double-stranded beta helix superfamily)
MPYSLEIFVEDVRSALSAERDERRLVEHLKPLALRFASESKSWLKPEHYECDAEQGFGIHLLHEEPDHSLWIVAASWLPHRGPPPHNHGTWALVAGVDGKEKNILWRRRGERLERQGEETVGPGQITSFLPQAIHSVVNESDQVSVSLHVYGKNLNRAGRSQFDPESGVERPFIVKVD